MSKTTKKYTASTVVSISVRVGQAGVHVAFMPLTGGGSVYYTSDEAMQQALARHPRYGRLFREDKEDAPEAAPAPAAPAAEKGVEPRTVEVDCLDDAREWLCREFGASRTKMKTNEAVKAIASAHGVIFKGI